MDLLDQQVSNPQIIRVNRPVQSQNLLLVPPDVALNLLELRLQRLVGLVRNPETQAITRHKPDPRGMYLFCVRISATI